MFQCELFDGAKCEGCKHSTPHERKGECDLTAGECRRGFGRCQCIEVASVPTVAEPQPTPPVADTTTGAFDSKGLAARIGASVKFVVKHRQRLPGAFRVGRSWRFDKCAVERKLLSGSLL
jgi:hypothetical protein